VSIAAAVLIIGSVAGRGLKSEFVPKGSTPKPATITEDGSAAEIDLYNYDFNAWTTGAWPLRRIVVRGGED